MTFTNGSHRVTATLTFDDEGDLAEFWSDDRPGSSTGGFIPMRWSTPISKYRDVGGRRLLQNVAQAGPGLLEGVLQEQPEVYSWLGATYLPGDSVTP